MGFDANSGLESVVKLTKDYFAKVNQAAAETYKTQYDNWFNVCIAKGEVVPNKPVPDFARVVDDSGLVTVSAEYVCPPGPDPVFGGLKPSGFNTTQNDPYLGHLIAIEQMLIQIKAKIGA